MKQAKPITVARCIHCEALGIPPQYVCRRCGKTEFDAAEIPGRGTVYTHTTIRVAPEAFRDQAPYAIVIVDLKPQLRVTARVVNAPGQVLAIGQALIFDRIDEHGYWFRPVA